MLTAVYLSIQRYKLVFLMSHSIFTNSFYVGMVAREKAKVASSKPHFL